MLFGVLGPLIVVDDGVDVTPNATQQRLLLAALVSAAPNAVDIDALGDLLWPDGPPSGNALQVLVSKLRRAVPSATITSGPAGYRFEPGPDDRIDVDQFEAAVRRGRRAGEAGDVDEAIGQYTDALALVRGRPLADIASTELGQAAAARLGALIAGARTARLEALVAAGRLGDAGAELEALVAEDPLNEHCWALLMTVRARQGRPSDALRAYAEARRVLAEELGVEPGPELRTLERQVLDQDPALAPPAASPRPTRPHLTVHSLPARLSSLVGRDDLIERLATDLDRQRLVTVVGPGGAGKTSIALELARRVAPSSAAFVELAPVDDPDSVATTVADALGIAGADAPVPGTRGSTVGRLVDALAGERLLLVLDNCEHVVEAAAKLSHALLEGCPGVTVVATSREALGVPGELVFLLPPLDHDDAVALFLERAAAVAPGFCEREVDIDVVRRLCERVDNLPLAIELAAARVRSMHPTELLDRLDDRFAVLTGGARTLEPRQQTLRAVVDWSYDLLDDLERTVLRRLAAFTGGATLLAAEAVCSDDEIVGSHQVSGVVERLIDKSLVVVHHHATGARYSMLQTLYDYAEARLVESGEVERVRTRHAEYFADLVAPARYGLLGREQRKWIERLGAERENIRHALDIAVARGDAPLALRLVAPIGWYYYMVAQSDTGTTALEDALSCPGPTDPAVRAVALAHYGWLAANGPTMNTALDATNEAMSLLPSLDDPCDEAFVLCTRIMAAFFAGRIDEVRRLVPATHDAARRAGDPWTDALCALVDGELAHHDGRADMAEAAFWRAVEGFGAVGDEFSLTMTLTEAAEIAEMRGDYEHALEMLTRGIEASARVGFSSHPLAMRTKVANITTLQGDLEAAERMHLELIDDVGDQSAPWLRALSYVGLAVIARRGGRVDDADAWLTKAWSVSRTREVPVTQAMVLVARGYTADMRGDAAAARQLQLEAYDAIQRHLMPRALANVLEGLAGALASAGTALEAEHAARLLGAADHLRRRSGGPMPDPERFDVDRAEQRARAVIGDARFDVEFASGSASDPDELVSAVGQPV